MNCAQCGKALDLVKLAQLEGEEPTTALPVTFHVARRRVRLWFCSLACVYWGGVLWARAGAPTTVKAVQLAFNGRVEVLK